MKALLAIELKRLIKPFLRSLIPAGVLALLGLARRSDSSDLIWLLMLVSAGMGTLVVPIQVARDKDSGVMSFLATLPYSGYQLMSVRVVAVAVYVLLGAVLAVFVGVVAGALPIRDSSALWQAGLFVGSAMSLFLVGVILAGLLARYSMARLLWTPLIIIAGSSVALDYFFPSFDAQEWLARTAPQQLVLIGGSVVAALLWIAAGVVFLSAMRTLQPHGGEPTNRATALLETWSVNEAKSGGNLA